MLPPLAALLKMTGGFRTCEYFPAPNARPHHFVSQTESTLDGRFIIEHFYNRGISEAAVIGLDAGSDRLVRTKIAQDGGWDVATAPKTERETWLWRSVTQLNKAASLTIIQRHTAGSYEFRATNQPGHGECGAPAIMADPRPSSEWRR